MRNLDKAAIEKCGIASLDLMERAGSALADAVRVRISKKSGPVVIVAGKGNNGGDGLVAARHLISDGHDVSVVILAGPSDLSPDAMANFLQLAPLTTHIYSVTNEAELSSVAPIIANASCIVDAIFGTGLASKVTGLPAAAIDLVNALGSYVIAADVPSGLSSDDGTVQGAAVRARRTVTFGLPKIGLFLRDGQNYAGEVTVADIGFPEAEVRKISSPFEMIEPSMFRKHFGARAADSHKGNFGHVVVFAGSRGHLGAGYLACMAALRSGCGLVTYCLPEKAFAKFDARYAEIMCDVIPDDGTAHFHPSGLAQAQAIADGKSAAVIGPAVGTEADTKKFVNAFVKDARVPLIIDADGLNVLDVAALKGRRAETVLTPHPGEMARLIGRGAGDVQSDRVRVALDFAKASGAIMILKGRGTVVATPSGRAAINPSGNAGMATAGMGDALSGILASFIGQGMPADDAAMAAVYIHGKAGNIAAEEHGERALITSDVIRRIGDAMREIENAYI